MYFFMVGRHGYSKDMDIERHGYDREHCLETIDNKYINKPTFSLQRFQHEV